MYLHVRRGIILIAISKDGMGTRESNLENGSRDSNTSSYKQ